MRKVLTIGCGAAFAAAFIGTFVRTTATYQIASASMEPTLHCASGPACSSLHPDEVLVSRLPYLVESPRRRDIVVVDPPGPGCSQRPLVKRIVGLPGEAIEQWRGKVYINGKPLHEPYVRPPGAGPDFSALHVPQGRYFVMGDNRTLSCDSRAFGAISGDEIVGKVLMIYSPFRRLGFR
jgi:signal peptidase I